MQKLLVEIRALDYSLGMETLLSHETQDALAMLAQVTASFEALATRTGENAEAFIAALKEDQKNFELSKKILA